MNSIRLNDLPRDILYRVVSKLPPKEFARTSILSSEWGSMWPACPRLTFDAVVVCKCDRNDLHGHVDKFVDYVDFVLWKHQDKVVETLEFRIDFVIDGLLLDDEIINSWVEFAVSSRTKHLTLDLKPERFMEYNNRYVFPFKLLDHRGRSMSSHLRQMQLSFVSLDPPSHFRGFPNLRKLYLQVVSVNGKDLENVLSRCCNLEWLHIDRCHDLKGEVIVNAPLTHLSYLRVEHCGWIDKIKFRAANLVTFVYKGDFIPIDLTHSFKLQSAHIELYGGIANFQHCITSFLNGFPCVQNLTFRFAMLFAKQPQWLWEDQFKQFYNLRRLQIFMMIRSRREYLGKIIQSFSFLRSMPCIEELEVHFHGEYGFWLVEEGHHAKDLPPSPCKYNYLKKICITGFQAARGQLEFLSHLVENAPALEVVNIKIKNFQSRELWPKKTSSGLPPREDAKRVFEEAKRIVTDCILRPLNVKIFNVTI